MHIVVVGGLERHESEIERRADERGHAVEFHRRLDRAWSWQLARDGCWRSSVDRDGF